MDFANVWALAVVKAWKDPNWKAAFKRDPRGELKKEFGFELDKEIKLNVLEASPGQLVEHTLTIPPPPADISALGDPEQLRDVLIKVCC